jgi:hypothetical protein
MGVRHIRLEDLSGWAHEQIARKLCVDRAGRQDDQPVVQSSTPIRAEGRSALIRSSLRVPNKTEADYNNRCLSGAGVYEPVTFRLPGGSRYTPDWMTVDGNGITFHEVKGSYRLHSQGRSRIAFRECAAAFPYFRWIWATRQKDGTYKIEVIDSATGREENYVMSSL